MNQETTYIVQVPFESKGEIYLKLPSGLSDCLLYTSDAADDP